MVKTSCWPILFLGILIAQLAIASAAARKSPPNTPPKGGPITSPQPLTTAPNTNEHNVPLDISYLCGDAPLDSPPVYTPTSAHPLNHLFTPSEVIKAVAAIPGTLRGNFKKYPGRFWNTSGDGSKDVLIPEVGEAPAEGWELVYFPILADGTKWAPPNRRANQDGGNFRVVYWVSKDKAQVKFIGLIYHPEKSNVFKRCKKYTSAELKEARAAGKKEGAGKGKAKAGAGKEKVGVKAGVKGKGRS